MRHTGLKNRHIKARRAIFFIILASLSACANVNHVSYTPGLEDVPLIGSAEDVARAKCNMMKITPDRKGYGACMSMFLGKEQPRDYPEVPLISANPSASEGKSVPAPPPAQRYNPGTISASLGASDDSVDIKLQDIAGIFVVPVSINDALTLNFFLDSGASGVSIPADVVLTLFRTGTLTSADFIGTTTYQLADGSVVPSKTFRIRTLRVGGRKISNVQGSVAGVQGSLLLGQSFLKRFKSWSIDNQRHVLRLE